MEVSDSNTGVIRRYENKVLNCIVNAPWYVPNSDLHRDLEIETVTDIIAKFANSHEDRLQDHINIEVSRLLNMNNTTKRLKWKKPFELVTCWNTRWFNGCMLVLITEVVYRVRKN
jgi:uncharacterized protein YeeX (DUF496 family)